MERTRKSLYVLHIELAKIVEKRARKWRKHVWIFIG